MTKGAAPNPMISRMMQVHIPRPNAAHDDTTPPCRFCDHPNVGMHNESTLMLRGSFVFNAEHGTAMFVLDPDIELVVFELPNNQYAFMYDTSAAAAATHTECITTLLKEVGLAAAEDDEEDAELEELDQDYEDD